MDLHVAQRELPYLRALPLLQPAGAIEHPTVSHHADKRGRKMALHIGPVIALHGLPYQALMMLRPGSVLPCGVLGFAGTAGKHGESHQCKQEAHNKF